MRSARSRHVRRSVSVEHPLGPYVTIRIREKDAHFVMGALYVDAAQWRRGHPNAEEWERKDMVETDERIAESMARQMRTRRRGVR